MRGLILLCLLSLVSCSNPAPYNDFEVKLREMFLKISLVREKHSSAGMNLEKEVQELLNITKHDDFISFFKNNNKTNSNKNITYIAKGSRVDFKNESMVQINSEYLRNISCNFYFKDDFRMVFSSDGNRIKIIRAFIIWTFK